MDICVIIDIEGSIDFQITNQAWSLMKKTAASLKTMTRHDLFGSRSALLTAMKLSFFLTDLGICRRFYFMLWCLFVKVLSNETYEATLCIVLRIRLHGIQGTEGSREIYQQRPKRKQRRRLYILCNWNLSAKRTLKLIELDLLRMVGITTQNTLMLKLDSHRFIS